VDVGAEVGRLFDDSSSPADGQPVAVIISGGVCAGKTTVRKQEYSSGHVLIDAADIFLSLSRGEYLDFPEALQLSMCLRAMSHMATRLMTVMSASRYGYDAASGKTPAAGSPRRHRPPPPSRRPPATLPEGRRARAHARAAPP